MELDQNKFMSLVMEKTNKKLNEATAQLIVLESQLQMAVEINTRLQEQLKELDKKTSK